MKKHEFRNSILDLEKRAEKTRAEGTEILEAFDNLNKTKLIGSSVIAEILRETISQIDKEIPRLVKEGTEVLVAASVLEEIMDKSKKKFILCLELLNYRYGTGNVKIYEFFMTANQRSFGYTAPKRLNCHKIVDEAFKRHQEDFTSVEAERFVVAAQVGKNLAKALEKYKAEASEGKDKLKTMSKLLAIYRKKLSLLRMVLKGELDKPDDVYDIIPRRPRKS